MTVPLLINVRDRFATTKALAGWGLTVPGVSVHLVDNASTYPPLLEWYDDLPPGITLHRLPKNYGPQAPFAIAPRVAGESQYYATTDCDLDLSGVPADAVLNAVGILEARPELRKVGLALRLDDLPDTPAGRSAREVEAGHWASRETILGVECCHANIDMTFYVARVRQAFCYGPAVRMAGAYQCRHVPWYYSRENLPEDERWYLENARMTGLFYSPRLQSEVNRK